MVYNGKSYEDWWFRGTPISGNLHMNVGQCEPDSQQNMAMLNWRVEKSNLATPTKYGSPLLPNITPMILETSLGKIESDKSTWNQKHRRNIKKTKSQHSPPFLTGNQWKHPQRDPTTRSLKCCWQHMLHHWVELFLGRSFQVQRWIPFKVSWKKKLKKSPIRIHQVHTHTCIIYICVCVCIYMFIYIWWVASIIIPDLELKKNMSSHIAEVSPARCSRQNYHWKLRQVKETRN